MSTTVLPQQILRIPMTLLAAASVTLGLFWLMNFLITSEEPELEPIPVVMLDFGRVPEMQPIEPSKPPAKQPPEVVAPPEPPVFSLPTGGGFTDIAVSTVMKMPPVRGEGFGRFNGDILPVVQVQPNYPSQAVSRGVEGYVIVEFDVAEDGSVRNPRVIEHHPNGVFDRTSLEAIQKFRYRPRMIDGEAAPVFGVMNKFTFQLDRG